MSYRYSKRSHRNLIGIYPDLAFAATEALKISQVDITVLDGIRTIQEQEELVESGASWTVDSYHLYGLAIDLTAYINGIRFELDPNKQVYTAMKSVIQAHGIKAECGMDLWDKDIYHWQMTGLKEQYDIRQIMPGIAT